MNLDTFKTENESSDIMTDPIPLNDSVKLEIDETENVPDLQNVMTVKAEIDDNEMGKCFLDNWPDPTQFCILIKNLEFLTDLLGCWLAASL